MQVVLLLLHLRSSMKNKREQTTGIEPASSAWEADHQHLYDNHSHCIADLHDEQLTGLILEHIKKNKQLSNFELQDIKIQLIGHYISPEK